MNLPSLSITDGVAAVLAVLIIGKLVFGGSRVKPTPLQGPPRTSFLYGYVTTLHGMAFPFDLMKDWMEQYGLVYGLPWFLGRNILVVGDPKALSHVLGRDTWEYRRGRLTQRLTEALVGGGVLSEESERHKTLRRALNPAFSNAAIRNLTSIFYESGYKLKSAWDNIIDAKSDGYAVIEIQEWMNRVSFDTIGLAGFSHDFETLEGKNPPVFRAFQNFGGGDKPVVTGVSLFAALLPKSMAILFPAFQQLDTLRRGMLSVAEEMLAVSKKEKAQGLHTNDKSIIGLLLATEQDMSAYELLSQMNTLLLAGYETTSISLTWSIIELCRNPDIQTKLRNEVQGFSMSDPSWDELTSASKMPYLDAFVHEILRIHSSVQETIRNATQDDVIPLTFPITTATGKVVNDIVVARDTTVRIPIYAINQSKVLWGPDATEFKPERWLQEDGIDKAKDLQAYRHLLTFIDGPRACLGRGFALAEFKAVLTVIIKNFAFEFNDKDTNIKWVPGVVPRPMLGKQKAAHVHVRVRRVD